MTINLWGERGDWPARRDRLRSGLAELSPALVTFQECIRRTDGASASDQAAEILPTGYSFVHQRHREADGQGVTTASRWPVGAVVEDDLKVTDRTGDFACTSLATEILAPAPFGRIWLVNNLPSWQPDFEHERMLQAVRTAQAGGEAGRGVAWPRGGGRGFRRRSDVDQHQVLDRSARARRRQRLLPRRLGGCGRWSRFDVRARQPLLGRLGLAISADRLRAGALRTPRRTNPRNRQGAARVRPGRHGGERPLRRLCRRECAG